MTAPKKWFKNPKDIFSCGKKLAIMNCSQWINIFISDSMKGLLVKRKNSSESCHLGRILWKLSGLGSWQLTVLIFDSEILPQTQDSTEGYQLDLKRGKSNRPELHRRSERQGGVRKCSLEGRSRSSGHRGTDPTTVVASPLLPRNPAPFVRSQWFQIHRQSL